jgi:Mg-chelatase subunit ChlD
MPTPSFCRRRAIRRAARRASPLAAALAAAALAGLTVACAAHDWNSPPPTAHRPPPPSTPPPPAVWPGRLWAGPSTGAPPAPSADDCDRAPRAFDLSAGPAWSGAIQPRAGAVDRLEAPRAALDRDDRAAHREGDAALAAEREAALAPLRLQRRAASESSIASPGGPPPAGPPPRGQADRVTAGVVDDNADFGAYLAYRQRHAGLPVRDLDVRDRVRLTLHDTDGRVVPDAEVSVTGEDGARDEGNGRTLFARTDGGGQAWLHPRAAGLRGDRFEVRVRKPGVDGMLTARAQWRRGQADALQLTLDGVAPLPPTRLDLVFLVDATGSMADEIRKLRDSMLAMAAQIGALPGRPSICYGLVAYRDRGDAFFVRAQDFTDDLDAFQHSLAALRADGGGDMPEALNEALHTAVHRLSWRGGDATRLVVLLADAPPHLDYGAPTYDDDAQGALARGIKLLTIGASGLDPTGEYVFRQLAQLTGGRFVFLTYADARDPRSGPGRETVHDVRGYSVETLDRLVVRLVREELARRPG